MKDWSEPSAIVYDSNLLGAWEPFIWTSENSSSSLLHCTFSQELSPHWVGVGRIEQDIVDVSSCMCFLCLIKSVPLSSNFTDAGHIIR